MLVVKTTSATAGRSAAPRPPAIRPRKRVPSSRRRNPGSVTRDVANLLLRGRSWRVRRRRSTRRCGRRGGLQRYGRSRSRRRRRILLLRSQALLEHRARNCGVARHQLKDEAESEKDAAAPPADSGEEISSLANTDQRIWRRARATEAGGQSGALPALQQDGEHHDDAVDDQQDQKKRVKH